MRVLMGFTGGQAWKLKNCCKEPTNANFLPETEEKAGRNMVGSAYFHQGPGAPLRCALKRSDEWRCAERGGGLYCFSM